jgi:lipopolysaccharide transport system ATP-binding protein
LIKNRMIQIVLGGRIAKNSEGLVEVRALKSINISIEDGDRVGIVGGNGAGKSTLLRVLSGVYAPSKGSIETSGKIGSLIDISLGIDPELTGRENIYIRGALLGLTKSEINCEIDKIIHFSEINEFIDMPVRTYSTGMHMRLAFSVSTAVRSEILLMDEWLSVGDEKFQHKATIRINELIAATKILIVASHSPKLIETTCNKVIWLDAGEIVMQGDTDMVLRSYLNSAN